jgi:hypothetical protein
VEAVNEDDHRCIFEISKKGNCGRTGRGKDGKPSLGFRTASPDALYLGWRQEAASVFCEELKKPMKLGAWHFSFLKKVKSYIIL